MKLGTAHKVTALTLFVAAFVVYVLTASRGVGAWESGQCLSAIGSLGNTHPPGSPFYVLVYHVFSLPLGFGTTAQQAGIVSALFAAGAVVMIYLITARIINSVVRIVNLIDRSILIHGGGIIAALSGGFCFSFWSIAGTASIEVLQAFLGLGIIWLGLQLYDSRDTTAALQRVLLISFLLGLATGVSATLLLLLVPVSLLIYHKYFYLFFHGYLALALLVVVSILLMELLSTFGIEVTAGALEVFGVTAGFGVLIAVLLIGALAVSIAYGIAKFYEVPVLRIAGVAVAVFMIGVSVQVLVPLRASQSIAVNHGTPATAEAFSVYRGERGSAPILGWIGSLFHEAETAVEQDNQSGFFADVKEGYIRYFFWNYMGKAGDITGAPPSFTGDIPHGPIQGRWSYNAVNYPIVLYGLPFLLGVIGMFRAVVAKPLLGGVILLVFLLTGIATVFFASTAEVSSRETDAGYVLSFLVFSILIGIGATTLAGWLATLFSSKALQERSIYRTTVAVATLVIMLIVSPLQIFGKNFPVCDKSNDFVVQDFAYNLLQSCEADAILFTYGDLDTYSTTYLQIAEGIRTDVSVVNLQMLEAGWYNLHIATETTPATPSVQTGIDPKTVLQRTGGDALAVFSRSWRTREREVRIPVPKQAWNDFSIALDPRKTIPDSVQITPKMSYISTAEFPVELPGFESEPVYYRHWRDEAVQGILEANAWKRPIYFSSTVDLDMLDGFSEYLCMEGLALRIVPFVVPEARRVMADGSQVFFTTTVSSYTQGVKRNIFKRAASNSHRSGYETVKGIVDNYRNGYIRLARYLIDIRKEEQAGAAVLDTMRTIFPENPYFMDYRYAFDVGMLYLRAGAVDRYQEMMTIVEDQCLASIDRNPYQIESVYSPYRYLLEYYQLEKRTGQMLAIVDRMIVVAPESEDLLSLRAELDSALTQRSFVN
ncbi:MAG: hypothetical protein CL946_05000 [Ectothiorhodospiraceae bacterium]|nr:hypothetical protein [Ectothiorhodospiraceae bacterium]